MNLTRRGLLIAYLLTGMQSYQKKWVALLRNKHTAKLGDSAPNAWRRHSWVLLPRNMLAVWVEDLKNGCNNSERGCEERPFSNAFCPVGAIAPKWVQLLRKMHAHNTEKVSFWPIIGWFCSEKRWLSASEILGAIAPNYARISPMTWIPKTGLVPTEILHAPHTEYTSSTQVQPLVYIRFSPVLLQPRNCRNNSLSPT